MKLPSWATKAFDTTLKRRQSGTRGSSVQRDPDPFRRWSYWVRNKKTEIKVRTYLSIALSVLLVILVVFREWRELNRALVFFTWLEWLFVLSLSAAPLVTLRYRRVCIIHRWHRAGWNEHLFFSAILVSALGGGAVCYQDVYQKLYQAGSQEKLDLLVMVILVATIAAAGWEIFGETLHSSHRDASFRHTMRLLLRLVDDFQSCGDQAPLSADQQLERFISELLESARETLCGKTEVAAGYLAATEDALMLVNFSQKADYYPELVIPLKDVDGRASPAAMAHNLTTQRVVYMPDKDTKEAWCILPIEGEGEDCDFPAPMMAGWISTPEPKSFENFRSVLCVPVRFKTESGVERKGGVLTFSTKKRNPFLNRDFIMAECFADVLAQVLAIKERRGPRQL